MRIRSLNEQWSIANGSLHGAMAASDLDREKRTNHPYNWAAEAFARARNVRDWEQTPEQSLDRLYQELEILDYSQRIKRYIDATVIYSNKGHKYP